MNRGKITRLAFAIVVLCFVLSTFVSLWSLRIMAQQNLRELSKVLAARIYDTISSELSESATVARTMASDYLLIDVLKGEARRDETENVEQMRNYLIGIRDGLNCEAAFVVSEQSGRYYSYSGLNKVIDPEHNDFDRWYTRLIESGRLYALDVDRDELGQDAWTVFVDARIQDMSGVLLGACGVGVRMTGSQALFSDLEREYGVRINLVNADGIIQIDTDETRLESAYPEPLTLRDSGEYVFQQLGRDRFLVTKYVENLGWYLVVQSEAGSVQNQFINVIILNVVLCLLVMVILVFAIRIIAVRTRALANASFRDQTTGLLNRRAFEEEKAERLMTPLKDDFIYITADVNGLKTANDTLGHAAGDELIKGAAACLKACFGKYGRIYRIGGDEFAAMLHMTEPELKDAMSAFEQMTAGWTGERVEALSVSCGYATSRELPSENLSELSRISDERMYASKAEYYRRTGKVRRQG